MALFVALAYTMYVLFSMTKSDKTTNILSKKDDVKSVKYIKQEVGATAIKKSDKKTSIKARAKAKDNTMIVTNSKVLNDLVNSLKKRDFKAFDEVYDAQIKVLRENQDNSQFYEDLKELFEGDKLSFELKDGIFGLLVDAGTKEAIETLFYMIDNDIIQDKELLFREGMYLSDSISRIKSDPSVDIKGLVQALKKGYKTTTNSRFRKISAKLIAEYESSYDTQVMLFRDYLNDNPPEVKEAALMGLKNLQGEEILPALHDYLRSDNKKVYQTAGMVLTQMGSDEAIRLFSDWLMSDADIENVDDIKVWFKDIISRRGVYSVAKSIEIEKIEDKDLREDMRIFLQDQINLHKN
jgi:HEAT repeat protein